ncbi:MAG: ATP synthase F0 subunit C [Planctomycetota bacterium]|jgi:ATP synthase F0 subunit c
MKAIKLLAVAFAVSLMLGTVEPVAAQGAKTVEVTVDRLIAPFSGQSFGKGIGAGLVLMGAAYGFGKIGSAALESMARQPETANKVQTAMIIIGALLEGATFFALIVCFTI